ncbi:MAG TPA: glycosyl hydrolase family 18 protein, partial [Acidobacteriaceae bacterium]|nr:glycosyl hydrolase family 18 protein [Acidobacteriaceae bacterium]
MALIAFALPAAASPPGHREHGRSGPAVIAYLFPRDHVIQPGEIAARKLTRINYAFANIQDGRIVIVSPADAPNLAALVALKQENPSLQIFISVGGWLWSGHFSDAALTSESRSRFIESVVAFVEQYKLDGLDIDWEFPGEVGAGNRFRPEDGRNFTLLLAELRKSFDSEEKKLGRPVLLSIAAGANDDFLEHT